MNFVSYHIDDEVTERQYDETTFRRLLRLLRPYSRLMVFAVTLLGLSAVFSNVIPLLNMKAIDNYINSRDISGATTELASSSSYHPLAKSIERGFAEILLIIAFFLVMQALTRYLHSLLLAYVGQRAMHDMRMSLFSHIQRLPVRYLDKNPVGRLMTRLTNDVEKIQQTMVSGLVQTVGDIGSIVVVLCFMMWVNWVLACICLCTVPIVFLISLLFEKYARESYLNIAKKIANLTAYLQESVTGMRIIQAFSQEENTFAKFCKRNAEHRDEWFRQIRNFAFYFPTVEFLGSLTVGFIVLYIGSQILQKHPMGSAGVSIGSMFAYIQWADRIYGPIRGLADRYNMLLEAMASAERIFSLLDTPTEPEDVYGKGKVLLAANSIHFEHVWFAYEGEQWVLKDIDLLIEKGETIAVVGFTGAGKSTLASLLCRLYDPQKGTVRIGGVDIREFRRSELRRHIGIVFQDVFLFSGSIAENIGFGVPNITQERIQECAEHANAARFIERIPEGYAYNVGERGCKLSAGQRQLIAFARILAYDPEVLVLDEATSNIDTETEYLIQDALRKVIRGRTSIVIAHRLSTILNADRIVVLHHGEIREIGSHQELLRRKGLYWLLYQLQYQSNGSCDDRVSSGISG